MRGGGGIWIGRLTGVYNLDITGFMAGFNLANAALADVGPRRAPVESHPGALNIGLTQDQVIEVFGHMMLYAGIAFARGAMDIANEIFTSAWKCCRAQFQSFSPGASPPKR